MEPEQSWPDNSRDERKAIQKRTGDESQGKLDGDAMYSVTRKREKPLTSLKFRLQA